MVLLYLTEYVVCPGTDNKTRTDGWAYLEMLGTQSDLDQALSSFILSSQNNLL